MHTTENTYTIGTVAEILQAEFVSECSSQDTVKHILIDSRRLISPEQSVFFALKTARNDGHKYLDELYEKGLRNFVVSSCEQINIKTGKANILLVEDTLKALQKLCATHRSHFDLPVVAVTGSNGKTIVKEWLFQLLSPDKKVVRSPKSYNSQIGVPLSVWQISAEDHLGIFEAGISEPNEMEALRNILKPDIGIFTNIGHAHDENFINTAQKIGEKLKLFTKVKTLIYCADYSDIQEIIIKSELLKNIDTFSWSKKKGSHLHISNIEKEKHHTLISAVYKNEVQHIKIPFTDDASVENAVNCWCYMLLAGYNTATIAARFLKLTNVAMRLELKEGVNNCTVINDAYNSDINSLTIALDFLKQQQQHPRKTLILSDILQSGKNEKSLYEEVAHLIKEKEVDRVIGIGKAIGKQANLFKTETLFYENTSEFIKSFSFSDFQNEAILLKGAREFEFEKIVGFLQQKTHETTLEINLNAILNNLNYYKSKLKPKVKLMAMVKAFSYGTGSFEIANVLQYNRVDYLGVAFSDEGKALRKAGINLPILVLNPDVSGFDDIIKYKLEPEIYSFRMLDLFLDALSRNDYSKKFKIHIKLDTGMHRLGFEAEKIEMLAARLTELKDRLTVASVFTHLAAADNPIQDEFTRQQVRIFEDMCIVLQKTVSNCFIKHVVNSAGITRFPEYQFEMVRLGLGLYGIAANDDEKRHVENVSMLKTTISQIKEISANDTIGYNRSGVAKSLMRIATVPVGYADGLSRSLSNGKWQMKVNGQMAPVVGNVCMDMCMIDITKIPAIEGDEVIVFDTENTLADMAVAMNTIPYEVLTSFSRRLKRVYFHE